jgi:hypothetical protein
VWRRGLLPVLEACGGGAACGRAGPWVNGARGAGWGREVLAAREEGEGRGGREKKKGKGKKERRKRKGEKEKGKRRKKRKGRKEKGKRKEKWRKKRKETGEEVLENLENC